MKLIGLAHLFVLFSFSALANAADQSLPIDQKGLPQQGLEKLQLALSHLNGKEPIAISLSSSFSENHDGAIKQGGISAVISENEQGFQLTYPPLELEKIAQEQEKNSELFGKPEAENNEEVVTSTLSAANKLKAMDLAKHINMAHELSLLIKRAKFLPGQSHYSPSQKSNTLTFEMPIELLLRNKRTRKYVDDFNATYTLFINADGIPLKSELTYKGSGSAYFVLYIKAYGTQSESYQVINNRLILTDSEYMQGTKSMFGDFERKGSQTLRLLNNSSE